MNSKFGDCCNCPALVDGRFFTEFRDRDALQFNIMKQNNITNNNDFRNYLITNATSLISSNIGNIENNYKCKYNNQGNQFTLPINSSQNIYVSAPTSSEVDGYSEPISMTVGKFNNIGVDLQSAN